MATTADARIVALDAETGKPCEGFGEHGFVSLTEHMGKVPPGFLFITSQPLVGKRPAKSQVRLIRGRLVPNCAEAIQ
ncbi:hypothetical protein [Caballeronia sp. LZ035]|uniref:hypothetical protein n=1 Tax=Caballeronia sp. LZ035 TaxID=3038568 RepID=UPI0038D39CD6